MSNLRPPPSPSACILRRKTWNMPSHACRVTVYHVTWFSCLETKWRLAIFLHSCLNYLLAGYENWRINLAPESELQSQSSFFNNLETVGHSCDVPLSSILVFEVFSCQTLWSYSKHSGFEKVDDKWHRQISQDDPQSLTSEKCKENTTYVLYIRPLNSYYMNVKICHSAY